MRAIVALVVASAIIAGVHFFLVASGAYQFGPRPSAVQVHERSAQGDYSLEITPTFDAEADSFALEPFSVLVQFRNQVLLRRVEPVPAGTELLIEHLSEVVEGANEFYIEVIPKEELAIAARGVRVRILRDGQSVAEKTLWSAPGGKVADKVTLVVPQQSPQAETAH